MRTRGFFVGSLMSHSLFSLEDLSIARSPSSLFPAVWFTAVVFPAFWITSIVFLAFWIISVVFPAFWITSVVFPAFWITAVVFPEFWLTSVVFPAFWFASVVFPAFWITVEVFLATEIIALVRPRGDPLLVFSARFSLGDHSSVPSKVARYNRP